MKAEVEKPARTAPKAAATDSNSSDDKPSRPRSNRPAADADKRRAAPRGKRPDRHDKGSASATDNRSKAPKPKAEAPIKMGTLGALLKEAGVAKSKK